MPEQGLRGLPNISQAIEARLVDADIATPEELRALGSREAYLRLRLRDNTACLNLLCALEGAIQGVRWFHLPPEVKQELRTFHRQLSK